ncbi:MAG: TRAP transporter substrate-binding protein DctP, partial [Desulfovibrionaceae bacterium]|nr:TRAP transporter substrate-binding protein DctP [Desulfovibrionaceae bacterium]
RYKAMDAIEAGKSGKMLEAAINKTGVVFIGWSENGFRELTTSKGPIHKPADMAGMKLRVCGTPIFSDIFTALGTNPQAINWSEAVTGFQQGIVDGQENPTTGINIPLKIWTWHKYHTDWHYMIDPLFLTANAKVWKSFTEEDQKIIKECAALAEKYGKALSRIGHDDGWALSYLQSINMVPAVTDPYKTMEENGMTVVRFTPEMIEEFYNATKSVRDKWTKEIGEDLVKAAEEDMKAAQ